MRVEEDGTLSFGDFTLTQKTKLDNFEFQKDVYKVKTLLRDHKTEMGCSSTNLYRKELLWNILQRQKMIAFTVSAKEDVQFTLELEPDCEYIVYVDDVNIGKMMTNLSGKLSVSAELQEGASAKIKVPRV